MTDVKDPRGKHVDEIDDLLGGDPESSHDAGGDVDDLLAASQSHPEHTAPIHGTGRVGTEKLPPYYRQHPNVSSAGFHRPSLTSISGKKKKKTSFLTAGVVVALFGAMTIFLWQLKPGFLTGRTPEKIEQERVAAQMESEKARALATSRCQATLQIIGAPPQAEVLLKVGQAPVEVGHMPVGTRLEFVAVHEGFLPKRVILPSTAHWDSGGDGKPRYELAVQLDPTPPRKPKAALSWPPGEPGSDVGGKGPPGSVRVISTPPGATVWLLAATGADATVEQLPCDKDFDVLLAGPTTFRKDMHVSAADFVVDSQVPPPAPGVTTRVARVNAPTSL
jgi:hypothetical protein